MTVALFICAISLASAASSAQDARSLTVDLGGDLKMDLVLIPAGTFVQGSPASEAGRGTDEVQRTVTLTQPFYLGKYPVTRAQFARFVGETKFRTDAEKGTSGGFGWDGVKFVQKKEYNWKNPGFKQTPDDPVTLITFNGARAFIAWLSEKSGRKFALPTEAQWEYACRAGTTTAYPNGDDPAKLTTIAWFRENSGNGTRRAGTTAPNPWGLGDMNGNVWEWCADWYAPYREGAVTDPFQSEPNLPDKPRRVLRGGSWAREAALARSATRYRNDPASRNADNGFRVMTFDAAPPPTAVEAPRSKSTVPGALNARTDDGHSAPAQPAQPAAARPSATVHRTSGGMGTMGVLFVVVLIGGIALVLIRLLRRLVRGGGIGVSHPPAAASPYRGSRTRLSTRIVDDGIWIESSELADGAMLDCRYVADGTSHHEQVTFRTGPRGQFVFTGSRPTSVSVTVAPGSLPSSLSTRGAAMDLGMGDDDDDIAGPPVVNPQRFRGHPPAY